ncbi:MAG: hypothetical protein E6Q97_18010 [Desulfurellales bacterium]|nr:MAG: hypothetical protein E6Q97_18010 [Desulfurellales bacterium]
MSPYEREMRLMSIVQDMERRGVHLDVGSLEHDTKLYQAKLLELDDSINELLGQTVSVDSKSGLLEAILKVGMADTSKLARTAKTGSYSASKDSLFAAVTEPELLGRLLVRGALATCVRTFMEPWLLQATQHGRLFVRWNQIRNYTDTGARTGRFSSTPNLQNVPTNWGILMSRLKSVGFELGWDMPVIRKYLIPKPGYIFIGRDYSAQEMRLLAHFAGGGMLESLQAEPTKDVHLIAAELANITRPEAKTLGFAVLYGAGVGRIAESLKISVSEATSIKSRYLAALPEIKRFSKELSELARMGSPITTLGGRQYYVESPKVIDGRLRTFEYKLTNYKIQGSAADQTKEAMYQYATNTKSGELVLTVHDQLVAQVPIDQAEAEMSILEAAVNGAFQETLKYKVISDPATAMNFGALK